MLVLEFKQGLAARRSNTYLQDARNTQGMMLKRLRNAMVEAPSFFLSSFLFLSFLVLLPCFSTFFFLSKFTLFLSMGVWPRGSRRKVCVCRVKMREEERRVQDFVILSLNLASLQKLTLSLFLLVLAEPKWGMGGWFLLFILFVSCFNFQHGIKYTSIKPSLIMYYQSNLVSHLHLN